MKRLILLILAITVLFLVAGTYQEDYYIIPDKAIRIRIIPNSNSIKDQFLKKQVKTNIELEVENDLKNSKDLETSRKILINNLNKYENVVANVLKNEQEKTNFSVDYGYHYFPEKKYKGVKYEAGNYESLLVTLGKGQGDNWWCVLFPPLCQLEAEDTNQDDIEYSFYVKELFEKFVS